VVDVDQALDQSISANPQIRVENALYTYEAQNKTLITREMASAAL
jgi:hypothetical protein